MTVRETLFKQCDVFIQRRLQTIKSSIADIQNALTTETKSSAGDKHETGRAMLQLDREKAGQQLAETQKMKALLDKIKTNNPTPMVSIGSVVYTSQKNYFIAISAGEIRLNNEVFYAISPATPLAQALLSKHVNDHINFRTFNFSIVKIL